MNLNYAPEHISIVTYQNVLYQRTRKHNGTQATCHCPSCDDPRLVQNTDDINRRKVLSNPPDKYTNMKSYFFFQLIQRVILYTISDQTDFAFSPRASLRDLDAGS